MPTIFKSDLERGDNVFRLKRDRPRVAQKTWSIDVLLVEDDAADTSLIMDVLRRNPSVGMAVATASADVVLFDIAAKRVRPNLILLDIHMPRLNGFRFLKALRAIPAMRTVPVVLLTTSRLARDVEEARASSASLFLVKPDSYDELNARLNAVIEQTVTGAWSDPNGLDHHR